MILQKYIRMFTVSQNLLIAAFKPKFAEPKKKVSDSGDRYVREDYRSGYRDSHDRDRDRDRYERSGAPGGYPYGDRDRDRDRGILCL